MIQMLLHGCNGKMGQVVTQLAAGDSEIEIVAGIDVSGSQSNGFPVFTAPEACTVKADVIVDFSNASAADMLLDYALQTKTPVVLCTTGLSEAQLERAADAGKEIPVLRSSNMSLGVNTILKLVQTAALVLANAGFDMEIIEKHHNQKVDAPSGTALALAEAMNEVLDGQYHYQYDRTAVRQKRDEKEIGIQAVRGGTITGEHQVLFCGPDEIVEIRHTAYSRSIFAKGALQAAKFLVKQPAGYYTMADVVDAG